jgi:hypothetical protein
MCDLKGLVAGLVIFVGKSMYVEKVVTWEDHFGVEVEGMHCLDITEEAQLEVLGWKLDDYDYTWTYSLKDEEDE